MGVLASATKILLMLGANRRNLFGDGVGTPVLEPRSETVTCLVVADWCCLVCGQRVALRGHGEYCRTQGADVSIILASYRNPDFQPPSYGISEIRTDYRSSN